MNYFDRLDYDRDTGLFRWNVSAPGIAKGRIAGYKSSWGYWTIKVGRKAYPAHRLAWFLAHARWPLGMLDHINGDRVDNRLANLREVTHSENMQNLRRSHADNRTGLLGVCWSNYHQRYKSYIQVDKKAHFIGYFDDPVEAHTAYLVKKRELHRTCSI